MFCLTIFTTRTKSYNKARNVADITNREHFEQQDRGEQFLAPPNTTSPTPHTALVIKSSSISHQFVQS